jgi:hypothetical protein
LVPNSAVKGISEKQWVEVAKSKNPVEIERRDVTVGLQNEKFTEIITGLKPGEEIYVPKFKK